MDRPKESSTFPGWLGWTISLWSLGLNVVGVMALVDTKIKWVHAFASVIHLYREAVSVPVAKFLRHLALRWELDLSWIPPWFPDYVPIAAVFSFSLVSSYSHLKGTSPISLALELGRDAIRDIRADISSIGYLLVGLLLLIFFALTSPLFVIVFPIVILVFLVGALYFDLMVVLGILRFLIVEVVPYLAIAALVVSCIWYFSSRASFFRQVRSIRLFIVRKIRRARRAFPTKLQKARTGFRRVVSEARTEMGRDFRFFLRLVVTQYAIAMAVLAVFLTMVVINSSLTP